MRRGGRIADRKIRLAAPKALALLLALLIVFSCAASAFAKNICETERKFRANYADNKSTPVRDMVLRVFSADRFCMLMEPREAIDVISTVKWGLDLGCVKGIKDWELSSLLYRVQSGHLGFLLKTGNFRFESDVCGDETLKENRLRAIVIQDAFKKISFEM